MFRSDSVYSNSLHSRLVWSENSLCLDSQCLKRRGCGEGSDMLPSTHYTDLKRLARRQQYNLVSGPRPATTAWPWILSKVASGSLRTPPDTTGCEEVHLDLKDSDKVELEKNVCSVDFTSRRLEQSQISVSLTSDSAAREPSGSRSPSIK